MKVILLRDVKGVGQIGEVKTVSDGYAMNHLIRNKFAEPATEEKLVKLEATRLQREKEKAAAEAALDTHIKSLEGGRVEITVRATEKGGLFKAVGVSEILRALKDQKQLDIPERAINLSAPLKTVGEHEVALHGAHAKAKLTVAILAQ